METIEVQLASPAGVWFCKFFYTFVLGLVFTKLIFMLDWAVRERLENRKERKLTAKNKGDVGSN